MIAKSSAPARTDAADRAAGGPLPAVDPVTGSKPQPASYEPLRSTLRPVEPSFGIEEGAALVAVERANGGELAPLLQVLWTLTVSRRRLTAEPGRLRSLDDTA